jgi:hypothetical protein
MRRALTGVAAEDGIDVFPGVPVFAEVLSAVLSGTFEPELAEGLLGPAFLELPLGFGRRRLGLEVLLELAGLSLGREVRNAPRTSSSS